MVISAKYRSLTLEELHALEKEFVDYLVLNGITADDWKRLKQNDPEKAEDIITLFSDVVFEGILRRVSYLEYRDRSEVRAFQCLGEKMVLVGMRSDVGGIDFRDSRFLEDAAKNPPAGIQVFTTDKKYKKPRESELFEMIEAGCTITDGRLFKVLCLALSP